MKKVVRLSARRENEKEKRSGYRYPGKIVAAAIWQGREEKEKVPVEAATSPGDKDKCINLF